MSRRGPSKDEPRGCWLDVTYEVRPGGWRGPANGQHLHPWQGTIPRPDTVYDLGEPGPDDARPDGRGQPEPQRAVHHRHRHCRDTLVLPALWMLNLTKGRSRRAIRAPVGAGGDVTDAGRYTHVQNDRAERENLHRRASRRQPFLLNYRRRSPPRAGPDGSNGKPKILDQAQDDRADRG